MEELYHVFAHTLSEQKLEREAAEQRLSELYKEQPLFLVYLLQFATSSLETIMSAGAVATPSSESIKMLLHIQLAAAIHFRNIISKSDWNRRVEINSTVREEIHQSIIRIQIEPHLHDKVRRQILSATDDLIAYDYPQRWTSLLTQLTECINECLPHISLNEQLEREQCEEQQHCALRLVALQRLKHCLAILRYVCESYEKVEQFNLTDINLFCAVYLPSLLQIMSPLFLQKLWEKELRCLHEQEVERTSNSVKSVITSLNSTNSIPTKHSISTTTIDTPLNLEEENVLSASSSSPILVETSHCMRLVLKCIWSLSVARLPKALNSNTLFDTFWQHCIRGPLQNALIYLLPWSFRQLQLLEHTPFTTSNSTTMCRSSCTNNDDDGSENNNAKCCANNYISYQEHFVSFQHSPMWRVLKWCLVLSNRYMQQLVLPASRAKRKVSSLSQHVQQEQYALQHASICLELIRWHCTLHCVTSKAYILAIENCITLLEDKVFYSQLIQPNMEELLTRLILPRLCISHEEIELWQSNPEEYIQRQHSPTGYLYSAKVNSSNLMLALLVAPTQSNENAWSNLLTCLYNYIEQQMEMHLPLSLEATDDDFHHATSAVCDDHSLPTQTHPSALMKVAAARCVDACLYCLFTLRKIICRQFNLFVRQKKNSKKRYNNQDNNQSCLILPRLESFVNKFVVSIVQNARLGILRARAVLVLSAYANAIHWSNEEHFRFVLGCTLALLNDPDEAVQLETCRVFASLVGHELARPVITPNVGPLVGQYFRIMRLANNDGVIHTLRKTITLYKDSLLQWAVQLTEMLVEQFNRTYHDILQKHLMDININNNNNNNHLEAGCNAKDNKNVSYQTNNNSACVSSDELVEALSAADELLETFITVIKALPASELTKCLRMDYLLSNITLNNISVELPHSLTHNDVINDVFMCIQERLGSMLVTLLSQQTESSYEFIDGVLRLAVLLLSRSVAVHTSMWALLPSLYVLIINGATDYFAEMIPLLEAFLHAAPFEFIFTPLSLLCSQSADNLVTIPINNNCMCTSAHKYNITDIISDNNDSDANVNMMSCTPAELVLRMCVLVMRSASLCIREVAGVPVLLTNIITCYWDMTQHTEITLRHYHLTCRHTNSLETHVIPSASVLLSKILSEILTVATHRPGQRNAFRLLLSNVLLTSIIADAPTTLHQLSSLHTLTSFFEHYVQLCMPAIGDDKNNINIHAESNPSKANSPCDQCKSVANTHNNDKHVLFQHLRSYDRALFVTAIVKMLECVCSTTVTTSTTTQMQIETWFDETLHVLCSVWQSGLINAYAQSEVEQSTSESKLHKKSILKLTRRTSTEDNVNNKLECKNEYDENVSNEGSEEWEDEEDSDQESESEESWLSEDYEEDDDDDDDDDNDGDDEEDDNTSYLYDDLNDSEEGKYQELLLQTEAARNGNKLNNESKLHYKMSENNDTINNDGDDDSDDDSDDIDNELLHDNDTTLLCSPVMRQNAWAELQRIILQECQHVQQSSQQQCDTMMFNELLLHLLTSMHHQCLDQGLVQGSASAHVNFVAEAAKTVNELVALRVKHTELTMKEGKVSWSLP